MKFWVFKSEPDAFSIDDLKSSPKKTSGWDGVRNYQARNLLRDEVKKGDLVIFYHSSCRPPGAVGLADVTKSGYPDRTDGSAESDPPRWFQVDVRYRAHFHEPVLLDAMREMKSLAELQLLKRGNRLSILPATRAQFRAIVKAGGLDPKEILGS